MRVPLDVGQRQTVVELVVEPALDGHFGFAEAMVGWLPLGPTFGAARSTNGAPRFLGVLPNTNRSPNRFSVCTPAVFTQLALGCFADPARPPRWAYDGQTLWES